MSWSVSGGTYWTTWPFNYSSYLATCSRFGISTTSASRCASSLVLVWYVMPKLLDWELLFTSTSFFWSPEVSLLSFSSKSSIVFYSLAYICCGDLIDEAKGCLVCYKQSLNFEVLTLEVDASCTLVDTSCSGVCCVGE
jgi:hypothetical protein